MNPETREEAPKRPGFWRWAMMIASILLVLILLAYLIFPRTLNPDRVIRFFRYMGLRDKESYGNIPFDANAANTFAGFDDGLLVGSETGLTLFSLDGEQKAFVQGSLPTPVVVCGGEVSLAFSPGSSYVAAVGAGGRTLMDETLGGSFLDADVSEDGFAAYITTESGYKSVTTVLNPRQDATFRFSSRTRYLNACAVNQGGSLLALASLGEEGSVYRSEVTILRTDESISSLDDDESLIRADLGNQVMFDLFFLDKTLLCAVGQKGISFLNSKGELLGSQDFEEGSLVDFSHSDTGFLLAAMDLGGGTYVLRTYNSQGELLGEQTLPDRIRSVSACGNYAAVLTDNYAQTYDRRLKEMDRCWEIGAASRIIARQDGTALLVSSGAARLYIP